MKICGLCVLEWTINRAESKGQKQTQRCINVACDNTEARQLRMLGQTTQQSVKEEKEVDFSIQIICIKVNWIKELNVKS